MTDNAEETDMRTGASNMKEATETATWDWWVEHEDGTPVFGPCVDQRMALSVRAVIEEQADRHDLWVRQTPDREDWVVWA